MTNCKSLNKKIWVVRAGKQDSARELFVTANVIALSDTGLGDLSIYEQSRDFYYSSYMKIHPNVTRVGSKGIAGKYFRFVNQINVNDIIISPSCIEKRLYVGEVIGNYIFVSSSDYPHQRDVEWKYIIPKNMFSQQAVYELGAARTFFEFKTNTQELLDMMGDEHFKI